MGSHLSLLAICTATAVDFGDEAACFGFREGFVFELVACKIGGLALKTRVVAQDPAVLGLCVSQRMAGEPFDAQLRMRSVCEVEQVQKGQDGAVRGPHHGDGLVPVAGDIRDEIAGFEDNVKIQRLDVEPGYGDGMGRRGRSSTEDQARRDELDLVGRTGILDAYRPARGLHVAELAALFARSRRNGQY